VGDYCILWSEFWRWGWALPGGFHPSKTRHNNPKFVANNNVDSTDKQRSMTTLLSPKPVTLYTLPLRTQYSSLCLYQERSPLSQAHMIVQQFFKPGGSRPKAKLGEEWQKAPTFGFCSN
jgi:hypothetical protein